MTALALPLLAAMAGSALGAPATKAQQAAFYEACSQRGGADLCRCKAGYAVEALDERMMGYVISAMTSNAVAPADINARWNDYIVGSMQACGSGI